MSYQIVHSRITPSQLTRLIVSPSELGPFLGFDRLAAEIDDATQLVLGALDSTEYLVDPRRWGGPGILAHAVFGGPRQITAREGYSVRYLDRGETHELAEALAAITVVDLRVRYDSQGYTRLGSHPPYWRRSEIDFEMAAEPVADLGAFFARARDAGMAVVTFGM